MADQDQNPVFAIQRMYLKDLSLEIPNAPGIFLETQQPAVEISLEVGSEVVTEGIFEVTVTVTISTKVGEKVAFLVEVKQAGIFELRNIPDEQMEMVINVVCPNIIYPYLRSNAADVIQRSGFPPIHLAEINFESLYQQRRQQAAEEAEGSASGIIV
ncbi:MAG: protein-export chaperone SecB, partial [Burkholderiaceae bacterium]|nr:protein-export chaperone SecB [Burkholderiaceae bacterium]